MNIDMVKPIEASIPKPISVRWLIALGRLAQRNFTINTVAPITPIGFPNHSPSVTPRAILVEKMSDILKFVKLIPALAMAKIGIITNVTIGASLCSSCCSRGMAMDVSCCMLVKTSTCPSSKVLTSFASSCSKRRVSFFMRLR